MMFTDFNIDQGSYELVNDMKRNRPVNEQNLNYTSHPFDVVSLCPCSFQN